jgi:ribonuclease P protein subunit POP4
LRTTRNILQHELIGTEVEITRCPFPEKCGSIGMIIDESRNMLIIENNGKETKVPKLGTALTFELPADSARPENLEKIEINAEKLLARPEDRVKRNDPKIRRK